MKVLLRLYEGSMKALLLRPYIIRSEPKEPQVLKLLKNVPGDSF
jgi:hypothetical protein